MKISNDTIKHTKKVQYLHTCDNFATIGVKSGLYSPSAFLACNTHTTHRSIDRTKSSPPFPKQRFTLTSLSSSNTPVRLWRNNWPRTTWRGALPEGEAPPAMHATLVRNRSSALPSGGSPHPCVHPSLTPCSIFTPSLSQTQQQQKTYSTKKTTHFPGTSDCPVSPPVCTYLSPTTRALFGARSPAITAHEQHQTR